MGRLQAQAFLFKRSYVLGMKYYLKNLEILRGNFNKNGIKMIQYHLVSAKTCVKVVNDWGNTLKIIVRVPQGDFLPTILFAI